MRELLEEIEKKAYKCFCGIQTCRFCGKQWKYSKRFRRHLPDCVMNRLQEVLKAK